MTLPERDFYASWLAASERNQADLDMAPVVARGRDLRWIDTINDYGTAMLIGPAAGFPTQGTNVSKVRLPAGHHGGRHRHGEEAIHVLTGTGALVADGRRYDFHPGTTIHVPFNAEHQLFNLGSNVVEYVSASAMDLDLFARMGALEQLEPKGANDPGRLAVLPAQAGQFDVEGRRIALHLEDAPDEQAPREQPRAAAGKVSSHGQGQEHRGHDRQAGDTQNPHRHGAIYTLMGGGESPSEERNGFRAVSVAMTNIFEELPHTSSHCHSHTEAVLYVLEGLGFSEIDNEHYDWQAGDAVHVPPRMTRHEHFNPSDDRTRTLRIEFGIRYFYEPLWKGFTKVEHRSTAVARP